MIQTPEAPVMYLGMPQSPSYGEPSSYKCARLIAEAFDNWEMTPSAATYTETEAGWHLLVVLDEGPAVRIEVDGSGRRTEVTVSVNGGTAEEVNLPMGEGWEPKAARIARQAWRSLR